MKPIIRAVLPGACAALLASCGGSGSPGATVIMPQATVTASITQSSSQTRVATDYTDYYDVVQRLYVGYFGRPADPDGLAFYGARYLEAGAATEVVGLSQSYFVNPSVAFLINSFGTSAESQALYPGDNLTFVTAIYRNLFNRDPEPAGLNFWVNAINTGAMTRAGAAVSIMAGAQTTDLDLINKKTRVATDFTNSLDTEAERAAYSGLAANEVVRAMLAMVGPGSDPNNLQPLIDSTIASLVNRPPPDTVSFSQVRTIINQRCVPCHSTNPSIVGFPSAPQGIRFDTEAEIRFYAPRIYQNAVQSQFMPYLNITQMTEEERALVGKWFNQGTP